VQLQSLGINELNPFVHKKYGSPPSVPKADLLPPPNNPVPPPKGFVVVVVVVGCPKTDVLDEVPAVGCPNALVVPPPNAPAPPEKAPKPDAGFGALKTLLVP